MVNISKFGDSAIKFTFTDNYRYLHNGEIEVPLNSLILVVDESDMVTFKKIDGDPFVSFLISDSNFESKESLIYFYKTSMVGSTGGGSESGITSGDVQTMIDTSLEDYYDIDEIDAALSGKADSSAVTEAITAAVSGKADTSSVYTKSEVDTALSAKQDISGMTAYTTSSDVETYVSGYTYDKATIDSKVASGGTFDPTNYYDKTATDALLDNKFDASAFTSYSAATDARISEDEEVTAAALNALNDGLSAKQDTLVAGNNITISGNVISAEGGIDSGTVQTMIDGSISGKADTSAVTVAINSAVSGKADSSAVTQEISAAVSGKVDTNAFNTYSAATNARLAEDEEVTAAALNDLNEALSGKADTSSVYTKSEVDTALNAKQDTLVSGTNIKTINNQNILGEGNIEIQGGGSDINVVQTTGTSTADVMSQSAVTNAFDAYTCQKNNDNGEVRYFYFPTPSHPYGSTTLIKNFSINGRCPLTQTNGSNSYIDKFSLVETSAITTSVTSSSTDAQVPSAKAVNDKLGGLKLVKLTQSEYDALATKDDNTLYVIVN